MWARPQERQGLFPQKYALCSDCNRKKTQFSEQHVYGNIGIYFFIYFFTQLICLSNSPDRLIDWCLHIYLRTTAYNV